MYIPDVINTLLMGLIFIVIEFLNSKRSIISMEVKPLHVVSDLKIYGNDGRLSVYGSDGNSHHRLVSIEGGGCSFGLVLPKRAVVHGVS